LHYNQIQHSKEALRKQINEVREFLESDKRVPLIEKGKIVLDKEGKEIYVTDQKGLKLAVELGEKLPALEEALQRLEDSSPEDTKFEGAFPTSHDLPDEEVESGDSLNSIEMWHKLNQKKEE
jgi:tRNA(Phe) wybutosine-synthesizing methylase Tyw3